MRPLLLALALLPGAAAMGRYVPEGCTETPDGNVVRVFELNDVCGGVTPTLAMDEACTDDNTYLLECYDKCQTLEPERGGQFTWADIGYNSPGTPLCGHSETVQCYCATSCPQLFGGDQGLIAGPCDADPPLTADTRGADSRETAPPAPEA